MIEALNKLPFFINASFTLTSEEKKIVLPLQS
jgi:hypothetical protein